MWIKAAESDGSDQDLDPKWNKKKPSRALIATSGNGGVIMEHVGYDIYHIINMYGADLDDCFLSDAPDGLSVWEGKYKSAYSLSGDYELEAVGDFRDLTPAEWGSLMRNEELWDTEAWMEKEEK